MMEKHIANPQISATQVLKNDLANVITSELKNKAMASCMDLHQYVHENYMHIRVGCPNPFQRIVGIGLGAYFHPNLPKTEYKKLNGADLEVLVEIASFLGFVIDLNFFRRERHT